MNVQQLTKGRLFWPLVALFLMVMVNFYFNHDFFSIKIVHGGLFGSVIDILNRAAPVMLIAMGMTLVIATRGIDISVGATVAISGAIAAALIGGSLEIKDGVQTYVSNTPMFLAILAAVGVGLLCGLWNGFLVAGVGMQPIIATLILMVSGRGIAQLITGGQIVTVYLRTIFLLWKWVLPRCTFCYLPCCCSCCGVAASCTSHGLGIVHSVRWLESDRFSFFRD